MSFAALAETLTELRRLAVAGAELAGADPRLARLEAPLERAGRRARVFSRLAEGLRALASEPAAEAPGRLLKLTTLTRAALTTQTAPAPAGELEVLGATAGWGQRSLQLSSRRLTRLRSSLTTRGSGRAGTLRSSMSGLRDLRLQPLLLPALDDAPIAQVVEAALAAQLSAAAPQPSLSNPSETAPVGAPGSATATGSPGSAADVGVPGSAASVEAPGSAASVEAPGSAASQAGAGGGAQASLPGRASGLGVDAGLVRMLDELEASLSGLPAGDARRLALITAAAPARGWALASRLLGAQPKAALRAQIYRSLADEPGALEVLLKGAGGGPEGTRKAAFGALARRAEPEAVQAVGAELGRPDKARSYLEPPLSYARLEEAFEHLRDPQLLRRMRAAVQDDELPTGGSNATWSRVDWARALAACPLNPENLEALRTTVEAGWAPMAATQLVARWAPLDALRRLLRPEILARLGGERGARSRGPNGLNAGERELDLVLTAVARLGPAESYACLSEGWGSNAALHAAMAYTREARGWSETQRGELRARRGGLGVIFACGEVLADPHPQAPRPGALDPRPGGEDAPPPPGAPEASTPAPAPGGEPAVWTPDLIRWDPRWLQDALRKHRIYEIAALAEPEDTEAGPEILARLPGVPVGRTLPLLDCLARVGSPGLGEAALQVVDRGLQQDHMLLVFVREQVQAFLGPDQREALEALLSSHPPHVRELFLHGSWRRP